MRTRGSEQPPRSPRRPIAKSDDGAGLLNIDKGDSTKWTVLYDEVLIVVAGQFRLRLSDQVIESTAGDVIWIPNGTTVAYEGEGAKLVYVLYPVNWRSLNAQ